MWRPEWADQALIRACPHEFHIGFGVTIGNDGEYWQVFRLVARFDALADAGCSIVIAIHVQDQSHDVRLDYFVADFVSIAKDRPCALRGENVLEHRKIVRVFSKDCDRGFGFYLMLHLIPSNIQ